MMAIRIVRDQPAKLDVVCKRMRPGSDERHVTTQDIDELRQLVHTGPAQPTAHARQAVIIWSGLDDRRAIFHHTHRAELQDVESPSIETAARLLEENRARRLD